MASGLRLNWRAFDGSVGTEHAAVSGLRLEHLAAPFAVVEVLARIRGHRFDGPMAAIRTGNGGLQDHGHAPQAMQDAHSAFPTNGLIASGTIGNERLHQPVNADATRGNRASQSQEAGLLRGFSDAKAG
jgi:hypothetical protein